MNKKSYLFKVVRSERKASNDIVPEFKSVAKGQNTAISELSLKDTELLFAELERWNDVLGDHKSAVMRGPRP